MTKKKVADESPLEKKTAKKTATAKGASPPDPTKATAKATKVAKAAKVAKATEPALEEEDDGPEPDVKTAELAWKSLKNPIQAHTESNRRLFLRPLSVVRQSINLAVQAKADREHFTLLSPPVFELAWLDSLEQRALAFWHTDVIWRRLSQQTLTTEFTTLLEEGSTLRAVLLEGAIYLWGNHPERGPIVADIRLGRGTEDTIDDLVRLSDLFSSHWADANGRSRVTQDDVNRAATLSTRLLQLLDNQPTEKEIQSALALRQQAWNYLDQAAWEVLTAGQYLFRHQNPTERYPNFQRAAPKKKPTESPSPTPTSL